MNKEILTIHDIKLLVDSFYSEVREDELLAPVFNHVIKDSWPVHLEKMYRFWQTILLEEHTYYGSPFPPHAELPVGKEHFVKWIQLFELTVDKLFTGEKATEAKWRSHKMAEMFLSKIEHYRKSGLKPLV